MRRVRYSVAVSLDGFISGPKGEIDWIVMDPSVDFKKLFKPFDTLLAGRRTYEMMAAAGRETMPGMTTLVFSRTLNPADHPKVRILGEDALGTLADLRSGSGKDLWLFGGGGLFRSLAEAGLVDTVELAVMPVLLGAGARLAPDLAERVSLELVKQESSAAGILRLEYRVRR